jgi:hypothetical protein
VLAAAGRPHEWHGGLVAVDIEGAVPDAIQEVLERLGAAGEIEWEWGKQPAFM